jgi:hypothetical protein
VVVGHGKSPQGKGWGAHIDQADVVIRMWDWHWQDQPDYGSKYDIGFLEIAPSLVRAFKEHNQHEPAIGFVGSLLWSWHVCALPPRCETIDQSRWNEIGKKMGGVGKTGKLQFTRGTIAACWAIEYAQPGDRVVLMGFDNVRLGKTLSPEAGFPEEYLKQPSTFTFKGYENNVRRYGHHDFGIEWPVLQALAEEHGVEIAFADDLWGVDGQVA